MSYDIQPVNVPGILNMYMQTRNAGLERMYTARKAEREETNYAFEQAKREAASRAITVTRRPHQPVQPAQTAQTAQPGGGLAGAFGVPVNAIPEKLGPVRSSVIARSGLTTLGKIMRAGKEVGAGIGGGLMQAAGVAGPAPAMPMEAEQAAPVEPRDDDVILSINPEGLADYAQRDPAGAMALYHANGEERAAMFKNIKDQVEFESQVIGAVRAQPEAHREQVYQGIRADLEAKGIKGLPAQWDEAHADAKVRLGMSALQSFQEGRAERRFEWDVKDDEADNARDDRDTDNRILDRDQRRGISERRLTTPRPASARPAATKAPSPSSVMGGILERYARGEPLSAHETELMNGYNSRGARRGGHAATPAPASPGLPVVHSPAEARKLKPGTRFQNPEGRVFTVPGA